MPILICRWNFPNCASKTFSHIQSMVVTEWNIHLFVHIAMCDRKQEQYELLFQDLVDYANKINTKP